MHLRRLLPFACSFAVALACTSAPNQPVPEASKSGPVPEASHSPPAPADSKSPPVPATSQPPAPAEPRAELPPPASKTPDPAASPVRWWCACYSRVGPTPATACRQAQVDCQRLEARARSGGGNSIVPGSLTHACREVAAEHPGDVLGTREQWKPSERPGAWVSFGACLLPGPPDVEKPAAPEPAEPPSILARDRLGDLTIDMPLADVEKQLGRPASRTRPEWFEGTVEFGQTWRYPAKGLELTLTAPSKGGPYTLAGLRATAPCALRTARGIGLGDAHAAVKAAYLADIDPEEQDADLSIVVGSIYSGIIFTFDAKLEKVTEIFLGAAAE
ncbi:hypothetical protein [Nannocystis sp. SCPEA4]|uniref:hypothetical protein n=1 Tax=Nannocystis sp. SCPEA4 TaxID=2996787 RepID=UPI00226FE421|nr:hypothetical protein [Nannocystis sp. SCPEA4]MCY1056886.1 hypothetical protein [Nannocystis sp. SCPEA4]